MNFLTCDQYNSTVNHFVFEPMRSFFIIITLLISGSFVQAQFNLGFQFINHIPVVADGDTLTMPWAGGLNNPQFSSIHFQDSNGVGVFVYDRDGALRKGFRYNDVTKQMNWVWRLQDSVLFENHFPKLNDRGFCILRDYNGDGLEDIFTTNNYDKIQAFQNTSSNSVLSFNLKNSEIETKNNNQKHPIRIYGNCIPVIHDLDNDGDIDILFFANNLAYQPFGCSTFASFMNQSIEEYGIPDSLKFAVKGRCWGKITPAGGTGANNWRAYDCDTTCQNDGNRSRDITMTQAMHDLNGDGTLDLMTSFDHQDGLFAMYNEGSNEAGTINLSLNDDQFPASDVAVKISNQPYPFFIDVDKDGDDDMIIGSNQINNYSSLEYDTSNARVVDIYYENRGSNSNPDFKLTGKGLFSSEMIDVGLRSFPAFADLNGDGLPDMVIGNIGFKTFNQDLDASGLSYYKNIGTEGHPVFQLVTNDLAGYKSLNLATAHPALADIDGDGDIDLFVGDEFGYLHFYKNIGYPQVFQFNHSESKYEGINAGNGAHPQFFDLNSDGLLDVITGDENGKINYFENSGSVTLGNFSSTPTIKNLGALNLLNSDGGKAVPFFTRKLDSLQNLFLLVGTGNGLIHVYGPVINIYDTFDLADSIQVEATETAITGVDLLGDSRIELVIGQRAGGLYFLNREKEIGVGIKSISTKNSELKLFPNPSKNSVTVSLACVPNSNATMQITDITGKILMQTIIRSNGGYFNENIDLRNYPSGVYFITVFGNQSTTWGKLIKE